MNNITIHFKDYSPVNDIAEVEKLQLQELYPDDENPVNRLCDDIEAQISKANGKNIYLLNVSGNVCLFSEFRGEIYTQGYVGIISFDKEDTRITVHFSSRFDNEDSRFLMYIFGKAYGLNGKLYEELAVESSFERAWDFLLMILFVNQLHEAMKNGVYKQYQEFFHNDSNIKGRIDIAEHIRRNPLNNGKVAYVTREFTANNYVNHLILKAYDHLENKYRDLFRRLIADDDICKKGIQSLKRETEDWKSEKDRVLIKNAGKKIVQAVYRKYEPLRRTSIAILKKLGINSFCNNGNSVDGMLIDMPKLWEQFLHKEIFCRIFGANISYSQQEYGILEGRRTLKPDFYFEKYKTVFDAKYKKHWEQDVEKNTWEGAREDVFQLLSYMYVLDCPKSGVIFPTSKKNLRPSVLKVGQKQMEADFWTIPVCVPQSQGVNNFRNNMDEEMSAIRNIIKSDIFGLNDTV